MYITYMFKLRHFKIHFKFDACYRPQNSWHGACLLCLIVNKILAHVI